MDQPAADELEPFTRDFGGLVRRVPRSVVATRSEAEVRAALQEARAAGLAPVVRGAGHSCHGQCLSDGGVVLANLDEDVHFQRLPGGRVELPARGRWGPIVRALHAEGRTPPVLTNHLGTTVGGTLSAGGFGIASIAAGAQIDHVERLRVIVPGGETVEGARAEIPELFAGALGGLGRAGVIETVVMPTVPWYPRAAFAAFAHDSLAGLIDALQPFATGAEAPDYFFAELRGRRFVAFHGAAVDEHGEGAAVVRLPPGDAERRTLDVESLIDFGAAPAPAGQCHVWSDYTFDLAGLAAFAAHVETGLRLGVLVPHLARLYLLALAAPPAGPRSPFDPRPAPAGERSFGIGLYYTVPATDAEGLRQARSRQDALLAVCLDLGGRPYLAGYHQLGAAAWARLYGGEPPPPNFTPLPAA